MPDHDDMGGIAGFDWQAARNESNEAELDRLRAECEALRADAERYRWLRCEAFLGCPSPEGSSLKDAFLVIQGYGYCLEDEQVDEAVDAARAARD
jgi:hypothetical protein